MQSEQYDKVIITTQANKDNKHLRVGRKLIIEALTNFANNMTCVNAIYHGLDDNNKIIVGVNVNVLNEATASNVEIEYWSSDENKGNVSIVLQEVLKDIYLNRVYDGYRIKSFFPETKIRNVFLAINDDNYASRAVAKKNGFSENERTKTFNLSEEDYLRMFREKKDEEIKKIFTSEEIGEATIGVSTNEKDDINRRLYMAQQIRLEDKEQNIS